VIGTVDTPQRRDERGRVVLLTGLSGAGMSGALKALEDLGYEAVDNLRLSLMPALLEIADPRRKPLALVVDSRTRDFSTEAFRSRLANLRASGDLDVRLVFLDCDDDVLQRRFTETRRRHPLADDRPIRDGIRIERELLASIRDEADLTFDTSALSIHDLKRLMAAEFGLSGGSALRVFVTSFSFRRGLPREADLVFDVRFLANPHWVPELRPLTGLDPEVAAHVEADPHFDAFFENLTGLLRPLLPRYNHEGKSYLTIAVGCSGGRHRSVYVACRLTEWLRTEGINVRATHRELGLVEGTDEPAGGASRPSGGSTEGEIAMKVST